MLICLQSNSLLTVNVSGQLNSHSQYYSQNSEISQQTPVQKLLSKAIVFPLIDITKLSEVGTIRLDIHSQRLLAVPKLHSCVKMRRKSLGWN
ncbi:uncharacterized protein LOC127087069 isoform X2 [Lathyrus oleraceus]|uniref:uncharacterized protein LOC127087069 isoform X2 n=1 Tax=Pisum sativum TaxID=3888 RepID=UPI0021CE5BA9|nr:uncharacterized protein LOC127087069 isoform X2 [Pisum sativum]